MCKQAELPLANSIAGLAVRCTVAVLELLRCRLLLLPVYNLAASIYLYGDRCRPQLFACRYVQPVSPYSIRYFISSMAKGEAWLGCMGAHDVMRSQQHHERRSHAVPHVVVAVPHYRPMLRVMTFIQCADGLADA